MIKLAGSVKKLWQETDNSSLTAFRILLGALLLVECINEMLSGAIKSLFIEPAFTFPFIGFEWLEPLPGNGMYVYYAVMALFAGMVMLGAFYRIAMAGFTLMWTAAYLMQKCSYNNHHYLIILTGMLMCCMPAAGNHSVDAWRRPSVKSNTCPQWCGWLIITQFGIMYTYAAVNKVYPDWLSGRYMHNVMEGRARDPLLGSLLQQRPVQLFICYAGILFDLLITPLMLWRRARPFAFVTACIFHLFNAYVFRIGIFPFLALSAMVFFFPPAQVRRVFRWKAFVADIRDERRITLWQQAGTCLMGIYLLIQLWLPLRYLLYTTAPCWTEEGFRMSWRMMLRNKKGWVYFRVIDVESGQSWVHEPERLLNRTSLSSLQGRPDMIWQYSQRLKRYFAEAGYPGVRIYAISQVSMNGRHPQPLIDPGVDLAQVEWQPYEHAEWIVPLDEE